MWKRCSLRERNPGCLLYTSTTPSVVAFLLGVLCVVGSLAVSVFFSARTLLDWQAIQFWRVEWLLAAVAAFAAGCLLKK